MISHLVALLLMCSCSSDQHRERQARIQEWNQANGKLKVLTTTEIIGDLAKQVGGEQVIVLSLIQGQLDPHSYQLVKGDDEKLALAEVIFYNGLGLEHGPSLHRYLSQNSQAISLGDQIARRYPERIIEVYGQKDPHIWMDISLWSETVPFIVEALSKKDPIHAADYEANGRALRAKMEERHRQVQDILHQLPDNQRYLVTSHDAFNYFARAYLSEEGEIASGEWQKRFAAPEGLAPESQLSTMHIKEIIHHLNRYHIRLLFPESNVSRDSIKKIVQAGKEQGMDLDIACCVLYGDAMGPPGSGADTYLDMILYNAKTLASHMGSPPTTLSQEPQ